MGKSTVIEPNVKHRRQRRIVALMLLAGACISAGSGCGFQRTSSDLGKIYNHEAQAPDTLRNPVILIPGILGSRLVDGESGRGVWGSLSSRDANPRSPEGARLMALPMAEGVPLSALHDGVRSDGPLDRVPVRIVGFIPVRVKAYSRILSTLGVGGYRTAAGRSRRNVDYGNEHFTCFQFDYDWRRDIAENARRLHEFIVEREAYVKTEMRKRYGIEQTAVKFDIVAHSMGGLLTRYYLRYGPQPLPDDGSLPKLSWAGSKYVERAILVAPPNAGAAGAFEDLIKGSQEAPFLPRYAPAIVGTMPAAYQLLPRPRHAAVVGKRQHADRLDLYDPELWERMGWGLASPKQDNVLKMLLPRVSDRESRLRIALDHQRKCLSRARAFHAAIDRPASPPPGLSLYLFAGDAIRTDATVAVDRETGRISVIEKHPGDGTVTRASALMDERVGNPVQARLVSPIHWTGVTFLLTDHLGLTKDPIFTDNLLALLLESPSSDSWGPPAGRTDNREFDLPDHGVTPTHRIPDRLPIAGRQQEKPR